MCWGGAVGDCVAEGGKGLLGEAHHLAQGDSHRPEGGFKFRISSILNRYGSVQQGKLIRFGDLMLEAVVTWAGLSCM